MKKGLSLFLALTFMCALLAGCAGNTTSSKASGTSSTASQAMSSETASKKPLDPYNVQWILRISPRDEAATKAVLANINDKVLPGLLENTTMSVEWIPASEYVEKMKLKFSGQEAFDVCLSMANYNFQGFVEDGGLISLDDYMQYLPETQKIIPEAWWGATSVNGKVYGIPNYQITARSYAVAIPNDVIAKYNVKVDTLKTLEDLEPILDSMSKDEKYAKATIGWHANLLSYEGYSYCGLEQVSDMVAIQLSNPDKIINLFEDEKYIAAMQKLREWNQKGYYKLDVLDSGDQITLAKSGYFSLFFECWQPEQEVQLASKYGIDGTYAILVDPMVSTGTVRSTMTSISFTSKNPARAAMLIDLVNSNADMFNALCWGVKDVNYTLNADGTASSIKDNGYDAYIWSYQMGNTLIGYPQAGKSATYISQVDQINQTATTSPILGFSFNSSAVATELAACKAISKNYSDGLSRGEFEDVAATMAQLNKELYAAGLQKILDEAQAQLTAWNKNK